MRIGLDGLPLTTPKTGVGHYTFELAVALASLRPDSEFELSYPTTYPAIRSINRNSAGPLPENLKFERVPVGLFGRHWWSTGLPRYIRRKGIELFHGTNYDVPLWRRCPTVLTVHDLSPLIHPETHTPRSVKRARRRLPIMARLADVIITPSESVKLELCAQLSIASNKVFAIPEAARHTFTPMEFNSSRATCKKLGIDGDFILAVGTIEPRKNLSVLIGAFNKISAEQREKNLQLVIAGARGWRSAPVFDAINESEGRDRILLTDYLYDEDLCALYSSCLAFVYPSIYEGFGLPPLEAMACGAPVIASRIAAIIETTGDAALLFDPADADDLAKSILNLLVNENARRELSIAGQRRAAEFSWERTAKLTWNVYEEALDRFSRH